MESRIKQNHEGHHRRPRRTRKPADATSAPDNPGVGHERGHGRSHDREREREQPGETPTLLRESMDEIGQIRFKLQDVLSDLERLLGILAEMEKVRGSSDEDLRPLREAIRELNREKV